ncbi:MAG TPA: DUF480 domain-containing protein [Planctomycetaceae bacterium]|nr:DUF480 domain-containing protein [Planctomycetaceae bacterium]
MTETPSNLPAPQNAAPSWQPLSSIDRRVLGVLIEKAKTTPDAYPLSLNAVCAGCNQKSNREPLMALEPEDVEESLDRLRECGAVAIVQGIGRVSKYRHYAYEWLGVDKVELAVMAELLLRGAQTEGELRGRAARMEPIAGLPELRPVLDSLKAKGLVIPLTPDGRGHVVTHALYPPRELEKLHAQYRGGGISNASQVVSPGAASERLTSSTTPAVAPSASSFRTAPSDESESVAHEVVELREQLAEMRREMDELAEAHRRVEDEVRGLRESLGG